MKHNGHLYFFFFGDFDFFFSRPHIHIHLLSFLILFLHSTFLSFPLLCLIFVLSYIFFPKPHAFYHCLGPAMLQEFMSIQLQLVLVSCFPSPAWPCCVFPSTSECLRLLYYDYLLHFSDCHFAFWHLTVCMPLPFPFDACHRWLPSCYVPVQSHPGFFHSMAASQIRSPLRGIWASSRLCSSTSVLHKPSLLVIRMFPTP